MAKSVLTNKQKERVYELNKEDGFSQNKLADLYDVSQGTISNTIREMRHEEEKAELKQVIENGMTRGYQAVIEEEIENRKQLEVPVIYLEN